jgi:hypothetical protein
MLTLRDRIPDTIDPAVYLADARATLPTGIEQLRSPEYLQALNLISMTALETNDMALLQAYTTPHSPSKASAMEIDGRWPYHLSSGKSVDDYFGIHTDSGYTVWLSWRQAAVTYLTSFGDDRGKAIEAKWLEGGNLFPDLYR